MSLSQRKRDFRSILFVAAIIGVLIWFSVVFSSGLIVRQTAPYPELSDPCGCSSLLENTSFHDSSYSCSVSWVFLAIGTKYRAMALAAISTLQEFGKWDGPIFIVNDAEAYDDFFRPEKLALLPFPEKLNFIHRERFDESVSDRIGIRAKLWKTELLRIIPCDVIFYMDVDVFVSTNVQPFLFEALLSERSLGCFRDSGAVHEKFHTGVMALYRGRSESILARWERGIIDEHIRKDQLVFEKVATDDDLYIFPQKYLMFPRPDNVHDHSYNMFVHLTSWRRRAKFEDEVLHKMYEHFHVDDPRITDWDQLPPSRTKFRNT